MRVGLDPATDQQTTSSKVNASLYKGDWIDHAQAGVNAVNKKVGIFSRMSAANERMESGNAYTIGITRFWNKNWKRGVGFRKLDPLVEAMLDRQAPGVKEAVYAAIEAGMNRDEINARLLGDFVKPNLNAVVDAAAARLYPNPDIRTAVLREQGIQAALERELAGASTVEDIDAAFARVESRLQDFVDEAATNDLVHQAEEAKNQVQQEGFGAVLSLFTDLQVKIATRWLHHFTEWQTLYNQRGTMNREQFDIQVRSQMATDQREWSRINTFELQTYKGIIQAIGMDTPSSRIYTHQLASLL
jgi:hypothetical protein